MEHPARGGWHRVCGGRCWWALVSQHHAVCPAGHCWPPSRAGHQHRGCSEGLGLALTLRGVLALAERVRLQHVLAAGTPGGEQTGLWGGVCPALWDPSVAEQPGRRGTGRAGGQAGRVAVGVGWQMKLQGWQLCFPCSVIPLQ